MDQYVVLEDAYLPEIDLRLKADERISGDDLPLDVLQLLWDRVVIDVDRGVAPAAIVEEQPDEAPELDDEPDADIDEDE